MVAVYVDEYVDEDVEVEEDVDKVRRRKIPGKGGAIARGRAQGTSRKNQQRTAKQNRNSRRTPAQRHFLRRISDLEKATCRRGHCKHHMRQGKITTELLKNCPRGFSNSPSRTLKISMGKHKIPAGSFSPQIISPPGTPPRPCGRCTSRWGRSLGAFAA